MKNKHVSAYNVAGYALTILDGKEPRYGWRKAQTDILFELDTPDQNFGVVLQKDDLVLDIDVKNGGKGLESFKQLTQDAGLERGWEESTFVVLTGSGGYHIYLKKDPNISICYENKQYPDIQFMSWGRQIVGAGCIHPDTKKPYTVTFRSPSEVAPAPASLLSIIQKTKVEHISTTTEDFIDDSEGNQDIVIDYLSRLPEMSEGGRSNAAYTAAKRCRDYGISQDTAVSILSKHYNGVKLTPPLDEDELATITHNAYKYVANHVGHANPKAIFTPLEDVENIVNANKTFDQKEVKEKGSKESKVIIRATLHNAVNYLATDPNLQVFQLNEFTQSLECQPTAKWWKYRMSKHVNLCDSDLIQVRYYLTETYRVEFSKEIIGEAIHLNGTRKAYHPVRQYLQSLKWDGVKRIDHWLHTYLHAPDTTYISDVGRKFLCAAVKRIMHPGCKFDYVMLLEGEQGIGKSSAMQTLARLWGADINIDPHNKDSVQAMMGSWIVELSEMAALKWADSEALKSFFSRRIDIVRVPYDKYPIPYPRQSVFVGTINREQIGYLADHTGNRRYWIVPVKGKIRVIDLENDADQLWAEAFVAYNNEPLYLIGESENTQKIEALARMPDDPIRQNIHEWLQENPGKTECNITDLLQYVGISFKMATKGDLARLSRAITSFGWTRVQRPDVPGMIFRKNTINLDDL